MNTSHKILSYAIKIQLLFIDNTTYTSHKASNYIVKTKFHTNASFKISSLIRALVYQYKFLCTISNNIEVFEEPVPVKKNCLIMQLNSRSMRRIELIRKACTPCRNFSNFFLKRQDQ